MTNSGTAAVHPYLSTEDAEAIRRAVGDAAERRGALAEALSVTAGVSGGTPPERFLYSVTLNASGEGEYRLIDDLNERTPVHIRFEVPADDVARVFGLLGSTEVMDASQPSKFTPDSLIGFVAVRSGEAENRTLFPVWDQASDGWSDPQLVPLPAGEMTLHVDPESVPEGVIEVFAKLADVAKPVYASEP